MTPDDAGALAADIALDLLDAPAVMSPSEARERTDRLRTTLEWAESEALELWRGMVWLALGYDSWQDYCRAEFPRGIPLDSWRPRAEIVASLHDGGMSTRHIGAALGKNQSTIVRDLGDASASVSDPSPVPVSSPDPEDSVSDLPDPGAVASELAGRDPEYAQRATDVRETAEHDIEREPSRPHVANNSGQNEWYTPPDLIAAAHATFTVEDVCEVCDDPGCAHPAITLDPASSDVAQRTVGAYRYLTAEQDGLAQDWFGNVWLNPPYAQPLVGRFVDKILSELAAGRVSQAIVLTNNGTETGWGQALLSNADAVCFPARRIRFLDETGQPGNTPLQGQMLTYFVNPQIRAEYAVDGEALSAPFARKFSPFGLVICRG